MEQQTSPSNSLGRIKEIIAYRSQVATRIEMKRWNSKNPISNGFWTKLQDANTERMHAEISQIRAKK